ncbi:MAG: hypothetical protein U1E02_22880 [Hydrogenophaga sp.]|nr:hypothetical protein [Hydrogenophaga sp.]
MRISWWWGGGDDCWSALGGRGNSPLLQAWGFALIGGGGPAVI